MQNQKLKHLQRLVSNLEDALIFPNDQIRQESPYRYVGSRFVLGKLFFVQTGVRQNGSRKLEIVVDPKKRIPQLKTRTCKFRL